jgi:hypothetical protein
VADRNEDGTFAPGNKANPTGANGHLKGWMRYGDRLQMWLERNAEEIGTYFENDGAELKKLSTIDAVCCVHARNMLVGSDTRSEREAALDRIEGKPKQVVAHGGDKDNPTPISVDGVFTLTFGTEDNNGGGSPAA